MRKGIRYFLGAFALLYFAASVWQKISPDEPKHNITDRIEDLTYTVSEGTSDTNDEDTWIDKAGRIGERIGNYVSELFSGVREKAEGSSATEEMQNDAISGDYQAATLVRVTDGDTIVVMLDGEETKIRMIGVDTPESVAPEEYLEKHDKENSEEGYAASDYTKALLDGVSTVYLEADELNEDQYGRYLRYVWLDVPTSKSTDTIATDMVNGILLRDKIAKPIPIEPNTKYESEFNEIYLTYSN